ncbi:chemotaxis protein [Streptococcus iniae]
MIHHVVLGLVIFTAVKIALIMIMSNIFLPKNGKQKATIEGKESELKPSKIGHLKAAEKFKRDYFLK